jgi:zinc transport system substrate-binding protein
MRFRAWAASAALATVAAGLTSACGQDDDAASGGSVQVVAAFYPLQFLAEQIGGDRVSVATLAPPGAEPHDLELTPRQVAGIVDADLVLYLAGFQPAVDEAIAQGAQETSLDAGTTVPLLDLDASAHSHDDGAPDEEEHAEDGKDPHLWLDPDRFATVGDAVAARLAQIDPEGATGYRQRVEALKGRLTALDGEYRTGLATCERREIVVSHAAFGYLGQRYNLEQVALSISPEGEPTPQRLAEVAQEAKEHDATTIFFERLVSPRVADAIATEVGARTAVLDPIEGQPEGTDYLGAMRANLATLKPALGCT